METDHSKLPLPNFGMRFETNLNLLNDLTFLKKNLKHNSLERPSYINLYILRVTYLPFKYKLHFYTLSKINILLFTIVKRLWTYGNGAI